MVQKLVLKDVHLANFLRCHEGRSISGHEGIRLIMSQNPEHISLCKDCLFILHYSTLLFFRRRLTISTAGRAPGIQQSEDMKPLWYVR
jgi:hypothetical protein